MDESDYRLSDDALTLAEQREREQTETTGESNASENHQSF